jgi:hypothetical protein
MCSSLAGSQKRARTSTAAHLGPRDILPAGRQPVVQRGVQLQRLPEAQPQPDVAEPPAAFQAEAAQVDSHGLGRRRLVKQAGLPFEADDGLGESTGPDPAGGVEFAELGDCLLADLVADANGTNESPIRMRLPVLADGGVTEIHQSPSWIASPPLQEGRLALHPPCRRPRQTQQELAPNNEQKLVKKVFELRKLG